MKCIECVDLWAGMSVGEGYLCNVLRYGVGRKETRSEGGASFVVGECWLNVECGWWRGE